MARDAGVPVWVGGMLESAVGASLCIELATLSNFTYPGDLFPSARFYQRDICDPEIEISPHNTFAPFSGRLPEPNAERLSTHTVRSATVTQNRGDN